MVIKDATYSIETVKTVKYSPEKPAGGRLL